MAAKLPNRGILNRAHKLRLMPTSLHAECYSQRGSAGLVIKGAALNGADVAKVYGGGA